MIRIDSREQRKEMKAIADEIKFLRYENPTDSDHPFSFDVEVISEAGQVFTYEVKQVMDAISSFSKIERQAGPCTGIIVEWNDRALALSGRLEDSKFASLVQAAKKRLWRLAHSKALIITRDVHETIAFLRYVEGKEEVIAVKETAL